MNSFEKLEFSRGKWFELERKLERTDALRAAAERATQIISDMPRGGPPAEDVKDVLADASRELAQTYRDWSAASAAALNEMKNFSEQEIFVLSEFYLYGKSLNEICEALNRTRRHCQKVKRRAAARMKSEAEAIAKTASD